MIDNKLQFYQTRAGYDAQEQAGNIPNDALVFVKDTHEIITHGEEGFGGNVAQIDSRIATAISGLDASVSKTAGADGLALSVTEVDGKVTAVDGSIAANTYDSYGSASAAQTAAATDATNKVDAAKTEIIGGATSSGNTLKKIEDRVYPLETAVGTGGSVDSRIATAKSEIIGDAATDYNTLGKLEDKVQAEATRAQEAEADRYTKEEVNNLITTPNQEYVSVTATSQTTSVTDVLPVTGAANTTYRVGNWDGTQYNDSVFSEYAWNGSAYIKLSTKSQIGEVYDISANHADTKYADLDAALGTNGANIPQSLRKGGMSVKFVQSSDNKYVQYSLMSDIFNTTVANWQRYANVSNYTDVDCTIEDEAGYAIAIFNEGHIKTKEFDSSKSIKNKNSGNDLEISDDTDYSVLMVKDGYPKTKNFDGEIIKEDLLNIDNKTKAIESAGLYETVTVNIADYNNNLMNVYAAINPTKQKHYTILIPEGIYNVNEWFTQAQIETSNETHWRGLELMDYTKLLGVGAADKIILQWMNPDSATHWGYISTLNTNHWHELENLTVKANNIRYAVHDDIWDGKDRYIRVKNCNFIVSGYTTRAWGAGTNGGYDGVFDHCHFIMEYYAPFDTAPTSSYINPLCLHDNPYNKGRDSHVVFRNCVFYVPYLNAMYYHPESWEQIARDENYPAWDNEKLDYVVGDCVNIRYDVEHSYRCIYAGAQVPPCLKGRASFSFGYGGYVESDDADGVLYASIEHCQCNTYYEGSAKCERVTGFCNIWDDAYLAEESDTKKNVIMDFRG